MGGHGEKPAQTSADQNQDQDQASQAHGWASNATTNEDSHAEPSTRRSSSIGSERRMTHPDIELGKPQQPLSDSDSSDDNVVWWDGDNDPENPYNWPQWRKSLNCILISALTFITPLASCMAPPRAQARSKPLLFLLMRYCYSNVCPRCSRAHGRIQERQLRAGLLLRLGLCAGFRRGAHDLCALIRALWPTHHLPHHQCRFHR